MYPEGAFFVPFPLKTGTNLLHPLPPSIVERVPDSGAGFHTHPPTKAFQHFECACETEVTRGIGVACVHNPRSGQERHVNADGVIEGWSAPAAVVAIKRRTHGNRFPEE